MSGLRIAVPDDDDGGAQEPGSSFAVEGAELSPPQGGCVIVDDRPQNVRGGRCWAVPPYQCLVSTLPLLRQLSWWGTDEARMVVALTAIQNDAMQYPAPPDSPATDDALLRVQRGIRGLFEGLPRPRVLALDVDETMGAFGPFCVALKVWRHFEGTYPPEDVSVRHHLAPEGFRGAFRPFLGELLREAQRMLDSGVLDRVAVFTSASNEGGYVDYVVRCALHHARTPDLNPRVLTREHARELSADGATVKDLRLLLS